MALGAAMAPAETSRAAVLTSTTIDLAALRNHFRERAGGAAATGPAPAEASAEEARDSGKQSDEKTHLELADEECQARTWTVGGSRRVRIGTPRTVSRSKLAVSPYPSSTDQLCWHCCHGFDGHPLPMPRSYDERRDVFLVHGTFCSFACMRRFNADSGGHVWGVRQTYIRLMQDKLVPAGERNYAPAPPRVALRAFGGYLSIDEFRARCASGWYCAELPLRCMPLETILHEVEANKRQRCTREAAARPVADLTHAVAFLGVDTRANETLRLRRPTPLASAANRNLLDFFGQKAG